METFAFYLLKSAVWLSGFALVYIVFLQNERYFVLNRIFLIGGILAAIFLPLYTWYYTVELNTESIEPFAGDQQQVMNDTTLVVDSFSVQKGLLFLYLVGMLFVIFRILKSTIPVLRVIFKTKVYRYGSTKLIRNVEFPASFSLISYVFVHPSIDEPELSEIVKHEQEHIRQKHWIDLLLFEILRTMQWFNPIAWFYGRLIRQNHEYLADKHALQSSSNPGIYRAALLNQTFGGSIIPLTSSFNYSFNKKRFKMMNHTIQSPFRKLKLLLIVPVFTGIFYAFATPEYQQKKTDPAVLSENNHTNQDTINNKTAFPDLHGNVAIGNIIWEGNSVYTDDELSQALGFKKGNVYSAEQLDKQLHAVSDLYLNNGYLFFGLHRTQVLWRSPGVDKVADLKIEIFEGGQYKIRNVEVKGNEKVSKEDILEICSVKSGDLFSKDKLIQSYNDLVETGKFFPEEIVPDVKPDLSTQGYTFGSVDIVFNVKEK